MNPMDLEIEPAVEPVSTAIATAGLMEVLPADFPLPLLTRFVPDVALRDAAQQATTYALSIVVTGTEGLQRADAALTALRGAQKAIVETFADPADIANRLHKHITGLRADWTGPGDEAIKTVGRRIWTEQQRIAALDAEQRRKDQAEADRQARAHLAREAETAKANQAPAAVVQELTRQAQTATAAPVSSPVTSAPLRGSTAVTTWKARPKGTPGDTEPNPEIAEMTPDQIARVHELLTDILIGKAPITAIALNYSVLNARAKSDKTTFAIAGFEAFQDGGVRAKGRR